MSHPFPEAFSLGVNYPWVNYGQDFGRSPWGASGVSTPNTRREVAADFARVRDIGASLVRWFLFTDGRSGFLDKQGIPTGPDDLLFADVGAALELARSSGLRICFSLIDFLWLQDRASGPAAREGNTRADTLKFPAGREAFLDRVLIPLFREFRAHPALFCWEIANEPEWAIREFRAGQFNDRMPERPGMHLQDFRAYAQEIADAAHEFAQAPVTLGSARLIWMRAWSDLPLDFDQAHYYPQAERGEKAGLAGQLLALRSSADFERPLWLGELPAQDPSAPEYSLRAALDACKEAGLAGAAVWRWRKPEEGGGDVAFGMADPQMLQSWLAQNAESRA